MLWVNSSFPPEPLLSCHGSRPQRLACMAGAVTGGSGFMCRRSVLHPASSFTDPSFAGIVARPTIPAPQGRPLSALLARLMLDKGPRGQKAVKAKPGSAKEGEPGLFIG